MTDTLNRRITGENKLVDPSITGPSKEWHDIIKILGLVKRHAGVEIIQNKKSAIVLIGPHGQRGIELYSSSEATEPQGRIGKAVIYRDSQTGKYLPTNPNTSEQGGNGDTLAQQLLMEIAEMIADGNPEQVPNIVFPTISQASFEPNSGGYLGEMSAIQAAFPNSEVSTLLNQSTESFATPPEAVRDLTKGRALTPQQQAAILTARIAQDYRYSCVELATEQEITNIPLVLNIHTAFDRKPEKGGNPNIEVIIGTMHGLSTHDFEVEVLLARFLKGKGFGVILTSLFSPTEIEEINGEEAKPAVPGEEESFQKIDEYAKANDISPEEFGRDHLIEKLNRLRGTTFMPRLRDAIKEKGLDANIIQLEIVQSTMKNDVQRQKLASALAEFSLLYQQHAQNKQYS